MSHPGMDSKLSTVRGQSAILRLEDIFIYRDSSSNIQNHMPTRLSIYPRAGMSLKLKKRFFFKNFIEAFRQGIQPGSSTTLKKETKAIRDSIQSTFVAQVTSRTSQSILTLRTNRFVKTCSAYLQVGATTVFPSGRLNTIIMRALEVPLQRLLSALVLVVWKPDR